MKLLLATGYGHLPDVTGGLQSTLNDLCLALQERGVEPTVLCGYAAAVNSASAAPRSDDSLGYHVVRTPDPIGALTTVAAVVEPDAVVVHTGIKTVPMVVAAMQTGLPVGVSIHNVEHREFGGVLLPDPDIRYFANSAFTAARLKALCGIDAELLMPLVRAERYRVDTSREKILFINPTQIKGVEVFFGIAEQLPQLQFRVAESWNLNDNWRSYCRSRAAELDNVEWAQPTRDVHSLYGSARLLLMPSVWEEAFGRSALEAQHAGIPVIASRRGGLPEAVGDGGLLIDADAGVGAWVDAITRVTDDPALYDRLCDQARAHTDRIEFKADYIVSTLVTALRGSAG